VTANGTDAVLLIVRMPERSEAERIGEQLVERRLAASGTVVPAIHSFFRWEGKLQREHEALLLITTSTAHSDEAQAALRALHSHPDPEILEARVTAGSATYLQWLHSEVGPAERT
jgi:periplasmic divalent cation tolerance protein